MFLLRHHRNDLKFERQFLEILFYCLKYKKKFNVADPCIDFWGILSVEIFVEIFFSELKNFAKKSNEEKASKKMFADLESSSIFWKR